LSDLALPSRLDSLCLYLSGALWITKTIEPGNTELGGDNTEKNS
jgi:hypothetical protein